ADVRRIVAEREDDYGKQVHARVRAGGATAFDQERRGENQRHEEMEHAEADQATHTAREARPRRGTAHFQVIGIWERSAVVIEPESCVDDERAGDGGAEHQRGGETLLWTSRQEHEP